MLGNCCSIDKYWLCRRAVGQAVFDPYRGQILDYPQTACHRAPNRVPGRQRCVRIDNEELRAARPWTSIRHCDGAGWVIDDTLLREVFVRHGIAGATGPIAGRIPALQDINTFGCESMTGSVVIKATTREKCFRSNRLLGRLGPMQFRSRHSSCQVSTWWE